MRGRRRGDVDFLLDCDCIFIRIYNAYFSKKIYRPAASFIFALTPFTRWSSTLTVPPRDGCQAHTEPLVSNLMSEPDAAFYFDLASPLAYLAAERVLHTMPVATEWQPVLARELPGAESFAAFRCRDERGHLPLGGRAPRRASSACKSCAGPTRSRSTAPSRCAPPLTPSRSAESSPSRRPPSARRSPADARSSHRQRADRGGRLRDASVRRAEGRRSCARSASSCQPPPPRPPRSASATSQRCASGSRVFHGERALDEAAAYARRRPIAETAR